MRGMVIDMDEAKLQTMTQVQVFLEGTYDVVRKAPKEERYGFIERVLKRLIYPCPTTIRKRHGVTLS